MSDREHVDDEPEDERRGRGGRFRRMGRRFLGEPEEGKSILGEARDALGVVLEGSDKARSEVVRVVAREVRNYLEELGLKEDLRNLATNYSLELHASVNLRRLAPEEQAPRAPAPVKRSPRGEAGKPAAAKPEPFVAPPPEGEGETG